MTKLLTKIVFVLLPVFAIAITFELIARKVPTSYTSKLDNFNQKKSQIEILVMGNSHSNFGINPQYFGKEAFNFSNTSQGLYQDYRLLLKYLPECKNLKMVIIPISYFTLQSDLTKGSEAWRCAYYSLYLGVQTDTSLSKYDLRNYSALFLCDGPFNSVIRMRNSDKLSINKYGYQSPKKSELSIDKIINDSAGKKRVVSHDEYMHKSLIDFNIDTLDKMASELTKRNIKIIFVTTPVYKTYYQNITDCNYQLMINVIDLMVKKYSAVSCNYFYDNRFDISDFMDNDHLYADGAKKFSEILRHDVIDKMM